MYQTKQTHLKCVENIQNKSKANVQQKTHGLSRLLNYEGVKRRRQAYHSQEAFDQIFGYVFVQKYSFTVLPGQKLRENLRKHFKLDETPRNAEKIKEHQRKA